MTGTEVERVAHVGAPSADGFVVGRVSRSSSTRTPTGCASARSTPATATRTIVCGAPNVAAGPDGRRSRCPGAVMPDGTKLKQAKLRGVESDGMILSETELEIGEDADGIVVLDDAMPAPRRATPAGRGAADRRARAGARGQLEPRRLPRRLRRRPRGPRDHRRRRWRRRRGTEDAEADRRGRRRRLRLGHRRGPGALPAVHRPRLHRRRRSGPRRCG